MYGCDFRFWDHYRPAFDGPRFSQDARARKFGVTYIPSRPDKLGLCLDGMAIHRGGNSGYQALNLAVLFGAARVILLGYDMKHGAGGEVHWHGVHPAGLANPTRAGTLEGWANAFPHAARDAKRIGVEIVNATADTALTCFPRMTIEEALAGE